MDPKLKKLAYENATALDDLDSLQWHEQLVTNYSENFLREQLLRALKAKGINNRAAYFNTLVKKNGYRHSRS